MRLGSIFVKPFGGQPTRLFLEHVVKRVYKNTSCRLHMYTYFDWLHGNMATWLHGYMATWQRGYMATWQRGYMATWLHGYMATWQHGNMATWQHGNVATWLLDKSKGKGIRQRPK